MCSFEFQNIISLSKSLKPEKFFISLLRKKTVQRGSKELETNVSKDKSFSFLIFINGIKRARDRER